MPSDNTPVPNGPGRRAVLAAGAAALTAGAVKGANAAPKRGGTLRFGTTRGVSNELVGERATVMIAAGVLLVIQP